MADVFLSYGRSSLASARRISSALEAAGYSVWFDEDIPAHRSFSEVIEEQLESARAVIVLWSREAIQSQWVRSEANRAREAIGEACKSRDNTIHDLKAAVNRLEAALQTARARPSAPTGEGET